VHGDEAGLVEVDSKARGRSEVIKNVPEANSRGKIGVAEDKSIINILKHRARDGRVDGMAKVVRSKSLMDEALQDISDNDEQIGREGVPLSQPIFTMDPRIGNSVENNRSVTSVQNASHPMAPVLIEPSSTEDGKEANPVNIVEGFAKIDLEDDGWGLTEMAATDEVGGVDDVLRDATTREEARLVGVDKQVDGRLESRGEDFSDDFDNAILQGDGSKVGRRTGILAFRQKDEESPVDTSKIKSSREEIREHTKNVEGNAVPEGREEAGPKPSGPGLEPLFMRASSQTISSFQNWEERELGRGERVEYKEER
jgi:hypothetical protein